MNNDKIIIEWFEKQILEEGLTNIFNDIDAYSSWVKRDDNLLNYTKAIRQDLHKILRAVERIYYIEKLSCEKTENGEFLKENFMSHRKIEYQGIDMEYILIKYRSILDYCVELIKAYFPETEGYKLDGKYQYMNDILKGESQFNKYILSSKWYKCIKEIRDTIVHHGATCVVYSGKDLGFQIYDLDVDNLYYNSDYLKINENLYRVDMFLLLHIAYLYYFLDKLFKSIIMKNDKLYKDRNIIADKDKKEMKEWMEYILPKVNGNIFMISNCEMLNEWICKWKMYFNENESENM